jgi:hypothetical protein
MIVVNFNYRLVSHRYGFIPVKLINLEVSSAACIHGQILRWAVE